MTDAEKIEMLRKALRRTGGVLLWLGLDVKEIRHWELTDESGNVVTIADILQESSDALEATE